MKHHYWTARVPDAIVEFNATNDMRERNRLWATDIAPPVAALIRGVCSRHKWHCSDEIVLDQQTRLFMVLHKFDRSKVKSNGMSWFQYKIYWHFKQLYAGDPRSDTTRLHKQLDIQTTADLTAFEKELSKETEYDNPEYCDYDDTYRDAELFFTSRDS